MTSLLMSSQPIIIIIICIDFFDTDIQIPETWLRALLPFPTPPPERPGELAWMLLKWRRRNGSLGMSSRQ